SCMKSALLFSPWLKQCTPTVDGFLILGRAAFGPFLGQVMLCQDRIVLVRIRTVEHAHRQVEALLLQKMLVSHIMRMPAILSRFDLKIFRRRQDGTHTFVA